MLTKIYPTMDYNNRVLRRDPRIDHINAFIDQYNAINVTDKTSALKGIKILRKIDYLSSRLKEEGINNNEFALWATQNMVGEEISKVANNYPQEPERQKMNAVFAATSQVPSIAQWRRETTPRRTSLSAGFIGTRSRQYTEVDPYIHAVKVAEAEQIPGSEPSLELISATEALQTKLSEIEIPPDKPNMIAHFNDLSTKTNSYLFNLRYAEVNSLVQAVKVAEAEQAPHSESSLELIKATEALQSKLFSLEAPPINPDTLAQVRDLSGKTSGYLYNLMESIPSEKEKSQTSSASVISTDVLHDREKLVPLIQKMDFSSPEQTIPPPDDFELGDYQISFLGGRNNLNFEASNPQTGEKYIIRLEPAGSGEPLQIDTDYALIEEIKNHPDVSKYVAKDTTFFPTGIIPKPTPDGFQKKLYNIAVSEFCPRGDLGSALRKEHGVNSPDSDAPKNLEIIQTVSDRMEKTCAMAETFHQNNLIYPDYKAENLLERDDGSVITADLKAVTRTDNGMVMLEHIKGTTPPYAPPEFRNPPKELIDAEKYMTYQIGLMTYMLMTGVKGDDKHAALVQLDKDKKFDFDSHPIFQSEQGTAARQLIEQCMNQDPAQRPTIAEAKTQFAALKADAALKLNPEEEQEQEQSMTLN